MIEDWNTGKRVDVARDDDERVGSRNRREGFVWDRGNLKSRQLTSITQLITITRAASDP
jgi:hypothetical protein